jgi:hypothetical protein
LPLSIAPLLYQEVCRVHADYCAHYRWIAEALRRRAPTGNACSAERAPHLRSRQLRVQRVAKALRNHQQPEAAARFFAEALAYLDRLPSAVESTEAERHLQELVRGERQGALEPARFAALLERTVHDLNARWRTVTRRYAEAIRVEGAGFQ